MSSDNNNLVDIEDTFFLVAQSHECHHDTFYCIDKYYCPVRYYMFCSELRVATMIHILFSIPGHIERLTVVIMN